jgi:hypothetical protein
MSDFPTPNSRKQPYLAPLKLKDEKNPKVDEFKNFSGV